MDKPLLIVGSLVILGGAVAVFALRPSPAAPTSVKPVSSEVPSPTVAPIAPAAEPSPATERASAIPTAPVQPPVAASSPAPVPEPAAAVPPLAPTPPIVPTTPPSTAPERTVVGKSPYPAGGKPTGPFDIEWSFSVGTTSATGVITITQLASAPTVSIGVVARGSASLKQPFQERVEIPQDASRSFPVVVDLGTGAGSLVVTVTSEGADRRARSITIELVPQPAAESGVPAPGAESVVPATNPPNGVAPNPSVPLSGSRTIRDDSGEVIELNPSTPPPAK